MDHLYNLVDANSIFCFDRISIPCKFERLDLLLPGSVSQQSKSIGKVTNNKTKSLQEIDSLSREISNHFQILKQTLKNYPILVQKNVGQTSVLGQYYIDFKDFGGKLSFQNEVSKITEWFSLNCSNEISGQETEMKIFEFHSDYCQLEGEITYAASKTEQDKNVIHVEITKFDRQFDVSNCASEQPINISKAEIRNKMNLFYHSSISCYDMSLVDNLTISSYVAFKTETIDPISGQSEISWLRGQILSKYSQDSDKKSVSLLDLVDIDSGRVYLGVDIYKNVRNLHRNFYKFSKYFVKIVDLPYNVVEQLASLSTDDSRSVSLFKTAQGNYTISLFDCNILPKNNQRYRSVEIDEFMFAQNQMNEDPNNWQKPIKIDLFDCHSSCYLGDCKLITERGVKIRNEISEKLKNLTCRDVGSNPLEIQDLTTDQNEFYYVKSNRHINQYFRAKFTGKTIQRTYNPQPLPVLPNDQDQENSEDSALENNTKNEETAQKIDQFLDQSPVTVTEYQMCHIDLGSTDFYQIEAIKKLPDNDNFLKSQPICNFSIKIDGFQEAVKIFATYLQDKLDVLDLITKAQKQQFYAEKPDEYTERIDDDFKNQVDTSLRFLRKESKSEKCVVEWQPIKKLDNGTVLAKLFLNGNNFVSLFASEMLSNINDMPEHIQRNFEKIPNYLVENVSEAVFLKESEMPFCKIENRDWPSRVTSLAYLPNPVDNDASDPDDQNYHNFNFYFKILSNKIGQSTEPNFSKLLEKIYQKSYQIKSEQIQENQLVLAKLASEGSQVARTRVLSKNLMSVKVQNLDTLAIETVTTDEIRVIGDGNLESNNVFNFKRYPINIFKYEIPHKFYEKLSESQVKLVRKMLLTANQIYYRNKDASIFFKNVSFSRRNAIGIEQEVFEFEKLLSNGPILSNCNELGFRSRDDFSECLELFYPEVNFSSKKLLKRVQNFGSEESLNYQRKFGIG